MTKAQRSARAKRAGARRRKAMAAKAFLKKMNPGKSLKGTVGAMIRKLKGGGYSVIPVKEKKNPRKLTAYKKMMQRRPKFSKRKYRRFGGT